MSSGKQSDENECQRDVIEKAFEEVAAILRREGLEPTDRFSSAKQLTLPRRNLLGRSTREYQGGVFWPTRL